MLVYALIMFAAAVPFFLIGAALGRGKADLIMEHHQTNVKDKTAYAKAFRFPIFLIAVSLSLSGILALIRIHAIGTWGSLAVLALGLTAAMVWIVGIQLKYNSTNT